MATDILVSQADVFSHMRIINGMGISLCLSRLLVFASKFIQHPSKNKISYIHIGWILVVFLWIIQFWWDYLIESNSKTYDIVTYILELFYVFGLFFICVTLTPDDIKEYGDYETYFFSRKKWLFALFIFINSMQSFEQIRTSFIKNDTDNMVVLPVVMVLETIVILIAMNIKRRRFQYVMIGLLFSTIILDFIFLP
ncbi:hypothetical protein KHQ08_05850 [Pseudochrobactrum algeriensis]|uniref:hypothetical protein n=1 Tax=Pseudochrobactrum TaxID=354349 RepID=UPI001BCE9CEE|nr:MULTISPECIES: hypothetical protein [Pseudochrobactrum]MBX8813604.1 hypothetical protein [Ochrobactrum sp. MR34]QVQ37564.1 hypothetical protein KHQ08_05850 [Pseudochrobactrum algeriensis]QVQ40785.1 hypothetical protein KHQ07_04145 [Pseudochrobactrum algeriensis]QVQ44707.1 hypothetical protein KHQ09_06115 [Pseudochrobactrum algeriensis]QYM72690.1 hypothetical protein K1X45_14750 [Pseudochrobactrum sp. Wa41.01b-1]